MYKIEKENLEALFRKIAESQDLILPVKKETYPYGMNDSTDLFQKAGNVFIWSAAMYAREKSI